MTEGLLLKYNPNLKLLARNLRNNMTLQERKLWYDFLRFHPVRFLRQQVLGNYIVDFYSPSIKLVIELDGGQHYGVKEKQSDYIRDNYLRNKGLTVLRYINTDVDNNFEAVCNDIDKKICLLNPPCPPLQRGQNDL